MKFVLGIISTTLIVATTLEASILIGIEQKLTVDKLQFIANSLTRAGGRSDPMQEQTVYYEISDTILLQCSPYKPDKSGNGCDLVVNPVSQAKNGEISITIVKQIEKSLLIQKLFEIKEKVAGADANLTGEHLHIGNPLYSSLARAKDATHYYCAPEGQVGKKFWQCYLSIAETLSEHR